VIPFLLKANRIDDQENELPPLYEKQNLYTQTKIPSLLSKLRNADVSKIV